MIAVALDPPNPITDRPVGGNAVQTPFCVQPPSMPITTTAATFRVCNRCRSRCGNAVQIGAELRATGRNRHVPLMLAAASAAALDRSSTGRMMTWLRRRPPFHGGAQISPC